MNADRGLTVFCGLLGAYWLLSGLFSYGFWVNKGPGPGFLPAVIGGFTTVFAVMLFIKQQKEEAETFDIKAFLPMAAMVGFVLSIYVVGIFAAMFVFMAAWLVIRGAYSWMYSVVVAVAVTAVIWLIFEYWLQVPFPSGMISF